MIQHILKLFGNLQTCKPDSETVGWNSGTICFERETIYSASEVELESDSEVGLGSDSEVELGSDSGL